MAVCESEQEPEAPVLPKKELLLGELAATLALSFCVAPIVSTAVVEHVFQELLRQFYQKGETYLPNFGFLRYIEDRHCYEFVPCESFLRNMNRMQESIDSERFTMALVEKRVESLV